MRPICYHGPTDSGVDVRRHPVAATMGMRIRPANPADAGPMSKVHVDAWRTAYAGIVPVGHLAGLS